MDIYTIGHSVHSEEEFIELLNQAGIEFIADVRAFPGSRKFPHFKKSHMEKALPESGIQYKHFPLLGGRRNKSGLVQFELNSGWENQSFHNYADYTLSEAFSSGIQELEDTAKKKRVAYCCSERHPARCHRLIISNWLSAQGWDVKHILSDKTNDMVIDPHHLGKWGAIPIIEKDGVVVYPDIEKNQ